MVDVAGAEFNELSHLTVSDRCDETLEPPLLQSESNENSWDRKQLFLGSFPIVALLLWLPVVDCFRVVVFSRRAFHTMVISFDEFGHGGETGCRGDWLPR